MNMIIVILVYVVGYILAYCVGRAFYKKAFSSFSIPYSTGTRVFNLFIALFSWFGVIAYGICYLVISANDDKPAKW